MSVVTLDLSKCDDPRRPYFLLKKFRHILLISLSLLVTFTAFMLLLSHKADAVADQPRPHSPFPLAPVPRLTNDMSDRPEFSELDRVVDKFLRQWQINGASLAIAKNGRLIYAKGFGYADVAQKKEVQPYNIFRVASVSKLVTASAIMKLVEEGRLNLDSKVFGPTGILNDTMFCEIRDRRTLQITVKNLLEHSAGWSTRWGDPVFMSKEIANNRRVPMPICVDDIIGFVLSKPLHFNVGDHSSYSNLGYVILGRVIEKVAGMAYEDYVHTALLVPMGITNMCVGNSYPKDLYRDEVSYYDVWDAQPVMAFDNPNALVYKCNGGHDIHTLGAAGGWVASPVELIRFALCIDEDPAVPDVLKSTSIDKMVRNDSGFDPLGWRLTNARHWLRTGTLAGTSAALVRDTAGYTWAFVTNTSSWKGAIFSLKIDALISGAIAKESPKWEGFTYDLFSNEKIMAPTPINSINAEHVYLRP